MEHLEVMRSFRGRMIWCGAAALLVAMVLLMWGSVREDALTPDEPIHIAAGYINLKYGDGRLNPEHPPLLKLLAAIPVLALRLDFRLSQASEDTTLIQFLFGSGADPHQIAARARLAPMALTVGLGMVLFGWTWGFAGATAALLALIFYTWSPTVLTHGRLVTTDVAAACGGALAGFAFIRFLSQPLRPAALRGGLTLGLALLFKFSAVLLVPFFAVLTGVWSFLWPEKWRRYLAGFLLCSGSAALIVLLPYLWITSRYPPEAQLPDTHSYLFYYANGPAGGTGHLPPEEDFARLTRDRTRDLRACLHGLASLSLSYLKRCPADITIFLADKPLLRAWGHYLFGMLLTIQRATARSMDFPAYFRGEVSPTGWQLYFPVAYALKEPLPFHLASALALGLAFARVWAAPWSIRAFVAWLRCHPAETLMLGWIGLYWSVAIQANLNIGVRHLLPVMLFTIILTARELNQWIGARSSPSAGAHRPAWVRRLMLAGVLSWQVASVLHVYPSFLAYFNEVAGGPAGGADYVVDSNLDWGQDLRRLRAFVDVQGITQIAVDYFGLGAPHYALGEQYVRYVLGESYVPWWSAKGPYPGWVAVSATILKLAQGRWGPTVEFAPEDAYAWLLGRVPVATIGYSIWVFDLRHQEMGTDLPH